MSEFVKYIVFGYFGLMILNSLIAIIMYVSDKKKAVSGKMRTKEKHLLFIAVFTIYRSIFWSVRFFNWKINRPS